MNPRSITQTATRLSEGKDLKQLALYSAGALALANLLLLLVQELIGSLLTDATGLAALGKRSLLLTIQSIFSLAVTAPRRATHLHKHNYFQLRTLRQ